MVTRDSPITLELSATDRARIVDYLNLQLKAGQFGRFAICIRVLQLVGLNVTLKKGPRVINVHRLRR